MSYNILPKIADFGLARRGDSDQPQILPIQSDNYRAPEVILGTGWTYGADIWNLGVLVCFYLHCITVTQLINSLLNRRFGT